MPCPCFSTVHQVFFHRFTDLLALAEDIEDIKTTRVLRGRRGANSSPKMVKSKRPVPEDSDSNSDTDEVGQTVPWTRLNLAF